MGIPEGISAHTSPALALCHHPPRCGGTPAVVSSVWLGMQRLPGGMLNLSLALGYPKML